MTLNNTKKRRQSWFGAQFTINNLPFIPSSTTTTTTTTATTSPTEPTCPTVVKRAPLPLGNLSMPEPLFHDSYLNLDDDISPSTPDPSFESRWKSDFSKDYFSQPQNTLQDLGLAVEDDECSIVATFISIVNAGKPKVVDILPPSPPSSQGSPRRKAEVATRPAIIWRMPSYEESSSRSSQSICAMSERTHSFCSISTSPSSVSDECKTPELGSSTPTTTAIVDVENKSSHPSRTSTIRRHSRNLSASFSKAFIKGLKDIEPALPVLPVTFTPPPMPTSIFPSSLSYKVPPRTLARPTTLGPPMIQHDVQLSSHHLTLNVLPVLKRKKSLAGFLF